MRYMEVYPVYGVYTGVSGVWGVWYVAILVSQFYGVFRKGCVLFMCFLFQGVS